MDPTKTPRAQAVEHAPFDPSDTDGTTKADRWHIARRVPLGMIFFMLLGVAFAMVHHFYYNSLNLEPVTETEQEWALRIGTGLAFLAKACLITSATTSYQQDYWRILRSRPISIKGIDDLMGLVEDPYCFFSLEVLRKAWTSAVIALAIWCLPLSAVIPPASLTTAFLTSQQQSNSPVPIVNWTNIAFMYGTGAYAEFMDASPMQYRITASSAYTGRILPMLPRHQNYTYTLSFQGPKLRCGDVTNQTAFNTLQLNDTRLGRTTTYNATVPRKVIHYKELSKEDEFDIWFATPVRNFTCQTWNVTYTANFSFINGEQSIDVTDIRYDKRFTLGIDAGYCLYDWCAYRGWHAAVASIFTGALRQGGPGGYTLSTTKILETDLIGCPEMQSAATMAGNLEATCPAASLERAIEALSENATLSHFSGGSLLNFHWLRTDNMTMTPADVTISDTTLVYAYNSRSLLLSYAAAVLATLIILLAGLFALWSNGVAHTNTFSGLVRTTRNKDLDDWARGYCLGSDPVDKHIAKQKLQYGLLLGDNYSENDASLGLRHAAFGFEGTVTRLEKGDRCM